MYLFQNLRHAVRCMRACPGFALAVIATLGLTVGLSTTVFSVLDAVFIRSTATPPSTVFQRTATTPLTSCLSPGVHFSLRKVLYNHTR